MRRWLIALALVIFALLVALAVSAKQTPAQIEWTHSGVGVVNFECVIDGVVTGNLGLPTPSGTTYTANLSLCGTIAAGQHTLAIQACNGAGCVPSALLTLVKLEP
jgi:hypothetical protein